MTTTDFKTRFAPSPTGLLHLGNVRTALFNFLLARRYQGVFLLRIEDTDAIRGEEKYEAALQQDLQWLGLVWQEGPETGGEHGPYRQSERAAIYQAYYQQLQEQQLAYPCFCSEHELKLERKAQLAAGRPPRYGGRCRGLSQQEVEQRFAAGKPATLRFHVADDKVIEFDDKVRGAQRFSGSEIGDFVIRRSDGTPSFFFSNAVDDALMQVSLVVRGEDHLTNTPRQLLILQALGLRQPEYAHIALVVGADGAPLSKRHGSRTVQELRESGFLPAAIVNYLARVGHSYSDNDFMSLDELGAKLEVSHMHRAPARYDEQQLLYWQKEAVLQASDEDLWAWMSERLYSGARTQDFVPDDQRIAFVQAIRDNIVMPVDAFIWAGNLYTETGPYDSEARDVIRKAGSDFFHLAVDALKPSATDFKAYTKAVSASTGLKGKALFMPLRAALTGAIAHPELGSRWHNGPELVRVWQLLGEQRIRQRLARCADEISR